MNRADRMLAVLADGLPHTRAEIFNASGGFFLTNNAAAELRQQGHEVAHWTHTERDGERVSVYQLIEQGTLGEADAARAYASPSALPDRSSGAGVGVAAAPAPLPPSRVTETRESLNEMLREELALAYESLEKLMWAVPVSDAAGARRDERVVVVRRQISELESALIFEGAAA